MRIECKSCRYLIPATDINIRLAIAKCPRCNEVFDIVDQLEDQGDDSAWRVAKPKSFAIEQSGEELVITYCWFRHDFWFLAAWCVLWDGGVSVGIFQIAAMIWQQGNVGGQWAPLLVLVAMLLAGLAMTYYAVALALNRSVIRLSTSGELAVQHGPLPWWGNLRRNADDVRQFYCTPTAWTSNGRHHYDVMLLDRDQTRHKFLAALPEPEQALYVEQTLESALNLPDESVPGELGGD